MIPAYRFGVLPHCDPISIEHGLHMQLCSNTACVQHRSTYDLVGLGTEHQLVMFPHLGPRITPGSSTFSPPWPWRDLWGRGGACKLDLSVAALN